MTTVSRYPVRNRTAMTAVGVLAITSLLPASTALSQEQPMTTLGNGVAAEIVGSVAPVARTERNRSAPVPASSSAELMIGDKVQVSFFEQLDLGTGVDAGMLADARTFYQRLDLTGEHVVAADGTISIPLLGRFVVAGSTPEEIGAGIVEAYQSVMGRAGQVDIAILERKQVFVSGIVTSPGAFRFEPGMVVLQAVALAGGYDHGAEAAARLIEAQRERERQDQAVDRLKWLFARRDRLIEQRDARGDGQSLPQEQSDVTDDMTNKAIEGEGRLLEAELDAVSTADGLQSAKLANARQQVETIRTILELLGNQIDVRSERMRVLQQMQGRGIASVETLWNAQKEVGDLMMEKERLTAELAAAEHSVVQAEAEGAKLGADRRLQIERELTQVIEEIDRQTAIVDASQRMMGAFDTAAAGTLAGEPLTLRILRRTPDRTLTIEADESTDLLPGDVVKVEVAPRSDAVIASTRMMVR